MAQFADDIAQAGLTYGGYAALLVVGSMLFVEWHAPGLMQYILQSIDCEWSPF